MRASASTRLGRTPPFQAPYQNPRIGMWHTIMMIFGLLPVLPVGVAHAAHLRAGVAKVDITNTEAGLVNDRLYVKALVVSDDSTTAVIVTVDAVAIAEIGSIPNDYLANVRARLQQELDIKPANVIINASHCHGVVRSDVEDRTFLAVKQASQKMVSVNVGAGSGHEDRIMTNRRLRLKNGKEVDILRAYSFVPDEEVTEVGPMDPE